MILPPLSMWLRVESPEHRPVRLWLPLFLLWLLLLPIVVFVLTLTIVADLALFLVGERYHRYTLLLLGCFQLLAETRGMVVRFRGDRSVVDLTIA